MNYLNYKTLCQDYPQLEEQGWDEGDLWSFYRSGLLAARLDPDDCQFCYHEGDFRQLLNLNQS